MHSRTIFTIRLILDKIQPKLEKSSFVSTGQLAAD
jgi:hypothetical protein